MTLVAIDQPYAVTINPIFLEAEEQSLLLSVNLCMRRCLPTGETFAAKRSMDLLRIWSEKLCPPVVDLSGRVVAHLTGPIKMKSYSECELRVRFTDDAAWREISVSPVWLRGGFWGEVLDRFPIKGRDSLVVRPEFLCLWRG